MNMNEDIAENKNVDEKITLQEDHNKEYKKIEDLHKKAKHFNLKIKIISKENEKTVKSRKRNEKHKVATYLIADESGCINLVLWDEMIDRVELKKCYEIINSYVTIYRHSMQVSLGKYGELNDIDEEIEPELDNNLSKRYTKTRRKKRRYAKYATSSFDYSRYKKDPYDRYRKKY
jgi:ssDNA-binding replication factor A large subunit